MDGVELAWKEYADACLEHDAPHAAYAAEELHRLVPEQPTLSNESSDVLQDAQRDTTALRRLGQRLWRD